MTREEMIVFMHDVMGLSFRQIGRTFDMSHETARTIYLKYRPRFKLEEVLEYLKD